MGTCYRVTALSKMGFSGVGRRFPFPDRNKIFGSKEEATAFIKRVKKANKGLYNLRMLFGKPKVEAFC